MVSGAADARLPGFVQEPECVSWTSICFMAPLSKFLDLLPPAPLPCVQKRDAQNKFLQHKGAHTDPESILGRFGVGLNFESLLGNIPVTTSTKTFPKALRYKWEVLQYKWGAYRDTNGRSNDKISLSSERRGTKVLQYKYCSTNWRCIAMLF